MTKANNHVSKAKSLIKELYNSTDDFNLRTPLLKAYKRLEDGADVADLAAHAASAVNYIRKTDEITFTPEQDSAWRQLRDMGNLEVLYSDPKNNLLNIDEM
ncbi:hypothetical protein [Companilactobacillus ginsenosidimutans]|uniref:Bacteriocin immunity protein n=1 Tax=Companilactobacillus ginsenosidimutans TaxID=1007676 RepID=A0A0H4QK94_9LACO|nr:hypothetical protein [Companilactobacillus ginsenosidimutans]AKP67471.1 hypothetical protein ABM34_07970 [Companilactobacillus ginsenosidimutans]